MADSLDNLIDEDEMLIILVQGKSFLYDKSSNLYKDVQKKNEAWNEIASEMYHLMGKPMEAKLLAKKWKALKARYTSERRRVTEYIPSGSAAPVSKSQWKYYEVMKFLEKYVQHRQTFSNFQSSVTADLDTSSDEDYEDEEVAAETRQKSVECLEDEDSDDPMGESTSARPTEITGINNYLLVLRDAWRKIPEKNKRKCFFRLREVVRNKKKHLPLSP